MVGNKTLSGGKKREREEEKEGENCQSKILEEASGDGF